MLLSVIVPIYNVELYLRKCVDSILAQSYKDLEVILVDDGSTDASGAICDEYAKRDARVRVIHKENEGVVNARYAGACLAKADYVTFVDGDDWIMSGMYEALMKPVEESQVELVCSGLIRWWSENDWIKAYNHLLRPGLYEREEIETKIIPIMLWCEKINTWALEPSLCDKVWDKKLLMFHMEALHMHSFHYGDDSAVTYPYILQAQKIYCMDEAFYYHRQKKEKGDFAGYIKDDNYFGKLYEMYDYMVSRIQMSEYKEIVLKQLDYFYMKSVNYHKSKYQKIEKGNYYLFPFDKVPKNSRIVLYGAGNVGQEFYGQIQRLQYCEIVLWVDKAYYRYGSEVRNTECITDVDYDYIVVANVVEKSKGQIYKFLKNIGVEENKIII